MANSRPNFPVSVANRRFELLTRLNHAENLLRLMDNSTQPGDTIDAGLVFTAADSAHQHLIQAAALGEWLSADCQRDKEDHFQFLSQLDNALDSARMLLVLSGQESAHIQAAPILTASRHLQAAVSVALAHAEVLALTPDKEA